MITTLTVKNFRGLDGLVLEDLARVNVFVGLNGGGKTSVLEAASIAANPQSPGWLDLLNRWRELPSLTQRTSSTIAALFTGLDTDIPLEIAGQMEDNKPFAVQISATGGAHAQVEDSGATSDVIGASQSVDQFAGLEMKLKRPGKEDLIARLSLLENGFSQQASPDASGVKVGAFYIHARRSTSLGETATALTKLYQRRQKDEFIQAMSKVYPGLQDMAPGVIGNRLPMVFADTGAGSPMPVNLLGDGFCRAALMLTGIVQDGTSALMVDEIDSGLHHSAMSPLWQAICRGAAEHGKQVFSTTHNEEMLAGLLDGFRDAASDVAVYRIERDTSGRVNARRYSYESLRDAFEGGFDVR